MSAPSNDNTPNGQPVDELTVTIGAREIYDELKQLGTKFDALPIADHETRLRSLERWRYAAGGAMALASTALGLALGLRGH